MLGAAATYIAAIAAKWDPAVLGLGARRLKQSRW
jgi:hypothetical protein